MTQIPHRGREVAEALRTLDGEANTDQIAEQAGLAGVEVLVTAGQLAAKQMLRKVEKGSRKGNPRWRFPVAGEEGFGELV